MQQIDVLVNQAIQDKKFPGAVIGYLKNGEKSVQAYGTQTYDANSKKVTPQTQYDLASITKCIPTATLALLLIEQGKLSLDDKIVKFFPNLISKHRDEISVKHLLTYTVTFNLPSLSSVAESGGQAVMDATFSAEIIDKPGSTFAYSNVVSTLLALIVQQITGKNFIDFADEVFFSPLQMTTTTFSPTNAAPTEVQNGKLIQNTVHDESARALIDSGLTCGHAGLFSTANDLLIFADMLLKQGDLNEKRYLNPATVTMMHTNLLADIGEKFGAGWSVKNSPISTFNFMGDAVSDQAFGMTGFTGTSLVVDPIKKRALVILSNATFPTRNPDKEVMNSLRREIADIIFD